VRDSAKDNYKFSSIVMGLVNSVPFQMSRVPDGAPAAQVADAR
jgi:hypothetical protein